MPKKLSNLPHVPRSIWMLGCVSMLMDVSSEMVHSLLPLFLVTTLGVNVFVVGMIEGVAEAAALLVKVLSGGASDYLKRRKVLAVAGYGLAALTKPFFALAPSAALVFAARLTDRVGKGIRGAPRDALIADVTPGNARGAAYGLRQSLDTVGAVAGPLMAMGLMLLWANDFRAVFWVAAIPAFLSVAVLIFGVHEPQHEQADVHDNPFRWVNLSRLGRGYWWVVTVGAIFTLARFSEAFLILRAQEGGLPLAYAPLVLVVMNIAYSLSAYPFGKMADSMSHTVLLASGFIALLVSDLILSMGNSWSYVFAGVAFWGLHMGMTQGILAAMVANAAPEDLRGTAFGLFNLISGMALLFASALAGWLWQSLGAPVTFKVGAMFCGVAFFVLIFGKIKRMRSAASQR